MKIGILTLPLHTNYGGIMQAWALQSILKRLGHEPILINKERYVVPKIGGIILYLKRFIKKYFFRKKIDVFIEYHNLKKYRIISSNTQKFIDNNINYFTVKKLSSIKQTDFNLDAIVVGSDQIWRPLYIENTLRDSIANAYLDFCKNWNIKRIAYAASFGTDNWEYDKESTNVVSNLIRKFDYVSVRELSGVDLCSKHLQVTSSHVLDPTLLLDKKDYEKLISNEISCSRGRSGLFKYILDNNDIIERIVENISNDKKLSIKGIGVADHIETSNDVQPSVESWIASFRDAEFVVTDSFHACVFAIIFRTPFVVIGNKARGYSRFLSLLESLDLEDHLITSLSEYDPNKDYAIKDYSIELLRKKRSECLDILKTVCR